MNIKPAGADQQRRSKLIMICYIFLAFEAVSWAASASAAMAKHNEMLEQKYIFSEHGSIVLAASYSHLYVPVNLQPLRDYLKYLRKIQEKVAVATRHSTRYVGKSAYQLIQNEIEMAEKKFRELEDILAITDTDFEADDSQVTQYVNRRKRQIGILAVGLIGGLIGGLGGSTLMGMFGSRDLSNIKKAIRDNRQKIDMVVAMVKDVQTGITRNHHDIQRLVQMELQIANLVRQNNVDNNINMASIAASNAFSIYINVYSVYMNGITTAVNQHRLHPELVEFEGLEASFKELVQSSRNKGYDVFTEDPRHAFQMPASYINSTTNDTTGGFGVVVHMPIASPKNIYKLYRFEELPVRIENLVVKLIPEHEFIAVSPDTKHYVPLTADDLESCDKFHQIHLCHQIRVARTFEEPTCIAHLWNNEDKKAMTECKIVIEKPSDQAIMTSENEFLMYSKDPGRATITCLNGTMQHMPVNEFTEITLPDGCWMDTEHLRLFSSQRSPITRKIPAYNWRFNMTRIFKDFTVDDIQKIVHNVVDAVGKPPTGKHELEAMLQKYVAKRKQDGSLMTPYHLSFSVIGIKIVVAVLIIVILVCVCRQCQRNKALKINFDAMNASKMRMSELMRRERARRPVSVPVTMPGAAPVQPLVPPAASKTNWYAVEPVNQTPTAPPPPAKYKKTKGPKMLDESSDYSEIEN